MSAFNSRDRSTRSARRAKSICIPQGEMTFARRTGTLRARSLSAKPIPAAMRMDPNIAVNQSLPTLRDSCRMASNIHKECQCASAPVMTRSARPIAPRAKPQSRVRAGADSVAIEATGGRVAIPGLRIQETQALGRAIDPGAPRKADQGGGQLVASRLDRGPTGSQVFDRSCVGGV